jgi:hypothetical protein
MLNVFADEWRECLRAHYMHVARTNDTKTLVSLLTVMQEVGFGEEELRELRVLATAHVDDVAEDFVPDLNILQPEEAQPAVEEAAHEAETPKDDPKNPKQLSLF